jgi:hypothetical protein
MDKAVKKYYWIGGGAGLFLALLLAIFIIAPRLVDSEWLRGKIQAELTSRMEGDVSFQTADLRFFPLPNIDIGNLSIEIPDLVSAKVESLEVYPALLPLLTGKVQIDEVQFNQPEMSMLLPDRSARKRPEEQEPRYTDWLEFTSKQLLSLVKVIPGIDIELYRGSIELVDKGQIIFFFKNINGEVEVEKENLTIDLSYSSNIADSIKLSASLLPSPLRGKGEIFLENISAKAASNYFFPNLKALVDEQFSSLQIEFTLDPEKRFQAKVQIADPAITIKHKEETIMLQGKILKGSLQLSEKKAQVDINDLTLTNPQVQISGTVLLDQSQPLYDINLQGRNIDVQSSRDLVPKILAAVYGDLPVVNDIFDYMRGGKISSAGFQVKGKSLDEISTLENMTVQGRLDQGKIHIPDFDLNLADVNGDAVITKAVLESTNLSAKMKGATAKNSSVKIGLMGEDDDPFHLDLQLDADLAEVPPVLKRIVTNKAFLEYMARLTKVSGSAQGRLVLGENFKSIETRVDVDQMDFVADYNMVPFPITVSSGNLHYEGDEIILKDIAGKVGKSSFSKLTGTQDWKAETLMEIESGNFKVELDQVHEWVASVEQLQNHLEDIQNVSGQVDVAIHRLTGPVLNAHKWDYEALVTFENAKAEITFFPEPITLTSGKAIFSPNIIDFDSLQATIFDSTFTVTGELAGFREDNLGTNLAMGGVINHDASRWLSELIDMPPGLYFQTPYTLSNAKFAWQDDKSISFAGDFTFKNGPKAAVDFIWQVEELTIKKLSIQDNVSLADFSLKSKERTVEFAYSGKLDRSTLENILMRDQYRIGWLQGDFEAHVFLDNPVASSVKGTIEGEDFVLPLLLEDPVHIRKISLEAKDNLLDLKDLDFNLHNNQFISQGTIKTVEGEFEVDLDLNIEKLVWEDMKGFLPEDEDKKESKESDQAESWNLPIHGLVRFKADTLTYGEYVLQPVLVIFTLDRDAVNINVTQADLCGISLPGSLQLTPGNYSMEIKPLAQNQDLQKTVDCFHPETLKMTGSYGLAGELTASGSSESVAKSIKGEIKFKAKNGAIHRQQMLSSVFSYLNLTDVFRLRLPSLDGREELKYKKLTAAMAFKNGRLEIQEAFLDSESIDVVTQGHIDYVEKKMNVVVLVVASKTVSKVTDKIPIVRRLTGSGSLFSVPVRVSGNLDNPTVIVLSPTALGSNILRILKKTFTGGVDFADVEAGKSAADKPTDSGTIEKEPEKQDQ